MRLSLLSRKLKLKPSELELFYENKGIKLLASSNSKLSDEQIKIALEYYNFQKEVEENPVVASDPLPQVNDQHQIKIPDLEIESDTAHANNLDIEKVNLKDIQLIEENKKANKPALFDLIDENIEVIKAPVIKLKGLTVKGKIELSPEKTKEKSPDNVKRKVPISNKSNTTNITSNSFNPLEAARKKKAKKERQLRKERADRLKKENKARYLKANVPRIESSKKKSNKKRKKEFKAHLNLDVPIDKVDQSMVSPHQNLNLFQRIWKWLNTY